MNQLQSEGHWREATELERSGLIDELTGSALRLKEEAPRPAECLVIIVDKRALERECLARGLLEHTPTFKITSVGSLDEFHRLPVDADGSVILVMLGARRLANPDVRNELTQFVDGAGSIPVIVFADSEEPAEILAALESGAKGFVPTSVKLKVAAEAIRLARAGGTFVPAHSLLALRGAIQSSSHTAQPLTGLFTAREAAVVDALRKGKANKIIAYELNLCESTVKVHIRNIMKKLKATNRTEVAYKLREMML